MSMDWFSWKSTGDPWLFTMKCKGFRLKFPIIHFCDCSKCVREYSCIRRIIDIVIMEHQKIAVITLMMMMMMMYTMRMYLIIYIYIF